MNLRTIWIHGLLLLALVLLPAAPARAQEETCYWSLVNEKPHTFTASTAEGATSSIDGTTITIAYQGLQTTHTWTAPGSILTPGQELEFEVSVAWDFDTSSDSSMVGGLKTYLKYNWTQYLEAGQKKINFGTETSGYLSNSAFYVVPVGAKAGDQLEFMAFADAAVAGGRVDYIYQYVCEAAPTETSAPTETPAPTQALTATPPACPALTDDEKLMKILDLYFERIPRGITTSGATNNFYDLLGYPGYHEFACGGYQSKVLNLFNTLRFSKDPCEQALFDQWDYGPIQAWFGGHQAVVLYPWATNWMETGLVLDPWIEQKPMVYEVVDWAAQFSATGLVPVVGTLPEEAIGGSFIGIGPSEVYRKTGAYPLFNGDYTPPGELKLTPAENAYIKSLPDDKQELFKKLTRLQQKQYLQMKLGGAGQIHKVVADCPVSLAVVGPDGARSGIAGGQVYTELEDVFFLVAPLVDGTTYTEMVYPANAGYTLRLEGTGGGPAYVLVAETLALEAFPGDIQQYALTVAAGQEYTVATDRLGAPMEGPGGSIQPDVLIAGTAPGWINSLPRLLPIGEPAQPVPTAPAAGLPGIELPANRNLLIGGIAALLVCGAALGLAAVVLLVAFARKRKTGRG